MKTKFNEVNETGRSMVEMLGVLAVMGVLSVGGVAMYTSAMNKLKANELLNEASKRAVIVSTRALSGQTSISLAEFSGHSSVAGATFADDETVDVSGSTFAIKIKNVDEGVCTQMKNTIGTNTVMREISGNCGSEVISLVFNKDLSTNASSSEPVIDTSIDNQEDCQNAGKTWCSGLNACSNVSDCCANISVSNPCQKCVSGTGEIVNLMKGASCDTNSDGTNDGICYPVAPTGGTCSGTSLENENLCMDGVPFQPSETAMCLPVSCKTLESMGLSQCCYEYNLDIILQQATSYLEAENMSGVYNMADQANIAQCVSCDAETGNTTPRTNGTSCDYVDVPTYLSSQQFLSGTCKKGKCTGGCDGFRDYYGGCHSCDTPEEVDVGCYDCVSMVPQIKKCPNRKLVLYDADRYAYSVLEYSEPVIPSGDGVWLCSWHAGLNPGFPGLIDIDECINVCQSSSTPRKELNGYCVPETCPAGSFRVVQGYEYYNHYGCESCETPWTITVSDKSDCDKCANDGAHTRTYVEENGSKYCRY